VTSQALKDWSSDRRARIQQLLDARARVGGSGAGRRWRTEQLNWSLVLCIASEFQGFSRALHDEGAEFFVQELGHSQPAVVAVVRQALVRERRLSRGNANPGNLGADFGRFGMQFWAQMQQRYPVTKGTQVQLEALNKARNAVAHADESVIQALSDDGWPLSQLATINRFRSATDKLARAMDTVVGDHLAQYFGGKAPW
jgi:hypothetical protein